MLPSEFGMLVWGNKPGIMKPYMIRRRDFTLIYRNNATKERERGS